MLLTITTTRQPASDLSYLLHKHPAKAQQVELSGGIAHVFFTEVSEEKCTAALLLDIDPVGLVRKKNSDFALEQYLNDRPYVASSFISAAIAKAFSTAMNGRCKDKPELVNVAMPFEVSIAVLPVRGGEKVLQELFAPLGYTIEAERHPLDPAFPAWGESRYFTVKLRHTITLKLLLSHLYILIPVCDNDKHYWVGQSEVEKLLEKGKDWLPSHPAIEMITFRYLKNRKALANEALETILKDEAVAEEIIPKEKIRVHDLRLQAVKDELLKTDARRIADLGCGEGKLLKLLLPEKQFEFILGMDVSFRSIEIVKDKLKIDRMTPGQQERIQLIQGALTYRDERLNGFDAAVLVEVIEHLDAPRLSALEKVVFKYAQPEMVIITTPNAEYNVKFPNMEEGQMRHSDHRFEWTRREFATWGNQVAEENAYTVIYKPLGEEDPEAGALSQMAIFTRNAKTDAER